MAKVQAIIAITLDGFLPEENEVLMQWIKNDSRGFPFWRNRCTFSLFPHYPLLDLLCQKDTQSESFVYLAEIYDKESAELLRGLFLYQLIDEVILYQMPTTYGKGINLKNYFYSASWALYKVKVFRNNICCMRYKKISNQIVP